MAGLENKNSRQDMSSILHSERVNGAEHDYTATARGKYWSRLMQH